jgi:hypothetical protein
MGHTGEARWCPTEASRRGDAKQPRRRAGRRAGTHWRAKSPPTRSADLDPVNTGRLRLRLVRGIGIRSLGMADRRKRLSTPLAGLAPRIG